jgi:outer membrane protein TolC
MKAGITICIFTMLCAVTTAQIANKLSIDSCYQLARKYYPLSRQSALIEQSSQYSIDNLSKGYLPQVSFAGQATYQSDVTKIPVKLPNVYIDDPSRAQYRLFAEVNQVLYDGGVLKQQQLLQKANTLIEQQNLETELYKLKERIYQLYFGILLIDAQLDQVKTFRKDIQSGLSKVEGAVKNGAALKSNLDVLKAELLKTDQRQVELTAGRKAYLNMLGLFIHQTPGEQTTLELPTRKTSTDKIRRPELKLFDLKKAVFDNQEKLINARNLPRVGIFIQGGYGRPALNMLSNKFELYSIGGVKLSWSLAGLYTSLNDKRSLGTGRRAVDLQKETFLFNTSVALQQHHAEIEKLQQLIKVDQEIILVRTSVKNAANAQLQYGTITANDYIREINAEDIAKQNLLLHRLQLLMAEYSLNVTAGDE